MRKFKVDKHMERKVRILGMDVNRFLLFSLWFIINLFVFISMPSVLSFFLALALIAAGLFGINQFKEEIKSEIDENLDIAFNEPPIDSTETEELNDVFQECVYQEVSH